MEHKPTAGGHSVALAFAILIAASALVCVAAMSLGWAGPGLGAGIVALSALGVALGLSNQQERRHSGR
ncbi:hypothetical protein A5733_24100 [Mycobacterium sp. NS-7484]|uniref:hypothetical protein n=1 Tax=unclassified Mycobacterium TaxID=2642494 RepID=UPI000800CC77|nr:MULTISPECIES: hypothetical protein [unclassified Mycobacterium]OBG87850.1 hypothetical protein A5699_18435 [Mycobacterium sp. E802]OMC03202.1 hypothetical protein A5733_24100 [Mycobacterium sp. NS-7484]